MELIGVANQLVSLSNMLGKSNMIIWNKEPWINKMWSAYNTPYITKFWEIRCLSMKMMWWNHFFKHQTSFIGKTNGCTLCDNRRPLGIWQGNGGTNASSYLFTPLSHFCKLGYWKQQDESLCPQSYFINNILSF